MGDGKPRALLLTAESGVQSQLTRDFTDVWNVIVQVFLWPWFFELITVPLLCAHLSPPCKSCDSHDQAAHYHVHGLSVGGLISDPALQRSQSRSLFLSC